MMDGPSKDGPWRNCFRCDQDQYHWVRNAAMNHEITMITYYNHTYNDYGWEPWNHSVFGMSRFWQNKFHKASHQERIVGKRRNHRTKRSSEWWSSTEWQWWDTIGTRARITIMDWWFGCHQFFIFPLILGISHHPNGLSLIFFRGVGFKPPTRDNWDNNHNITWRLLPRSTTKMGLES